jgi:hypothetical protein
MRTPLSAMQAYASILDLQTRPRLQPEESDLLRTIKVAVNSRSRPGAGRAWSTYRVR